MPKVLEIWGTAIQILPLFKDLAYKDYKEDMWISECQDSCLWTYVLYTRGVTIRKVSYAHVLDSFKHNIYSPLGIYNIWNLMTNGNVNFYGRLYTSSV